VIEVIELVLNTDAMTQDFKLSTAHIEKILESIPEAIIITDASHRIITSNQAASKVFGYEPKDIVGTSIIYLAPLCQHAFLAQALQEACDPGGASIKTVELSGRRADDSEFPLELTLAGWTADGQQFVTAIFHDLTEKKALEEVVQKKKIRIQKGKRDLVRKHKELNRLFDLVQVAKKEWELTMDCIGDVVILVDAEGMIRRCNTALTRLLGRQFKDIVAKHWQDLFQGHDVVSGESWGRGVTVFHQSSGRSFVLDLYPFTGPDNEFSGSVITLHDTTELRRATDELEEKNREIEASRASLATALDGISSLIERVATEQDFNVRFTGSPLRKCWEVMGCTKADCPCHGQEATRCWQKAGTFCNGEAQGAFAQKMGNCLQCKVYREATSDPINQIGEQFNNMMYILKMKNEQLAKAYSELKETQAKILQQEKMASIGQLAAGVAHEINNPIGFVASNLSTLKKYVSRLISFLAAQTSTDPSSPTPERLAGLRQELKIDHILEDISPLIDESLEGTDRVRKIVLDLKNFSRVDQADYKHADINECLDSTINIVWNEIKYKAHLKKRYDDLPLTKCYPQQLNQVFMNLLVNAAQAIEQQGVITVETRAENDAIVVSISDTGGGIPQEHLHRLFEPFFTTKEVGKGTGLGLSIAYDIVTKKHKGEITVLSEIGKGTTFSVRIPIVEGR